jgi:hypothetical protein
MRDIKEMIAVVQMYIHHRKDVEVQIKIESLQDIAKLTMAYNIASEWLNQNGFILNGRV